MYRFLIWPGSRVAKRLIGAFAACALLAPTAASANSVIFDFDRENDFILPQAAFAAFIDIELDDPGVTDVTVTMGTVQISLVEDPAGGLWSEGTDVTFTSLADLKAKVSGTWTISISGGASPSTSTFTVNANALVDGNFPPTPTSLSPAHGATEISASTPLTWSAAGITSPFVLDVFAGNDVGEQEAFNLDGGISLAATSWQPPLPLPNGPVEWGVFYALDPMSTVGLVGDFNVTQGSITWSNHSLVQLAGIGWPATKPFMALGSETVVGITVPEPAALLQAGSALAALALLAGLRSRARSGGA